MKVSEEEMDMIGVPPLDVAEKYGISVLIETLGARGARCYWHGQVIEATGKKTICVDATGAGDAFWGGFLSFLLRKGVRTSMDLTRDLLKRALDYGNVAGYLCVQKKGAMEALPTATEIEEILEKNV